MDKDRNLLFGVVAVQLRRVTPAQLVEIAGAWAMDPSKDIPQRLTDASILSEAERKRIEAFVDEIVMAHGEDSQAALNSLQQARTVQDSIEGICNTLDEVSPTAATKPAHLRWLEIGPLSAVPAVEETPGRYTHPSEYARGGVGRVLLVHDQHLGRDIALKELLPIAQGEGSTMKAGEQTPVQVSLSLVARFLQEARITGQLEHPSIVPVYELGRRRDGSIYYTMKLVRGKTLTALLKQAGDIKERVKLLPNFLDLCQAIGYAHSRGIIHRDVKPSNVMIGEFGETVVLDWGLAKIRGQEDAHLSELEHTLRTLQLSADAKSVETAEGQIMGTPVFMPPEQARGEIDSITERSDVYSLGAVLYSILAGRFPYRGKSAADVLRQVLAQEPEPIESIEPHAPPELVAVCRRAMHRDPAKRYANGKELAEEVGRFLSGALVGAYEYSFGEHLSRFAKRHKTALGTAAACVAVLIGFAVFSFARIAQERDEAVQARNAEEEQRLVAVQAKDDEQTQRARAEKQLYLSNVLLARYRIEERRFDLALQLLDAAPAAYRDWEWDYLTQLGHADSWTFGGHTQIVETVSVTADGARILTASDDGSARILDAMDGTEIKSLTSGGPSLVNAEINRGGSRALVQAADDSVTLFDTDSGAAMARLESIHTALLSASGEWFVTTAPDGQVQRWSEKGEMQWSAAGPPGLNSAVLGPDDRFVAVGDTDTAVMLLDAGTGSTVKAANTPAGPVNGMVFDSTGQRLAVTHGGQVSVFSVPAMEIGLTLDTGSSDVTSAAFNDDATRIATGSDDGSAAVWDTTNGGLIARLNGHSDSIVGMAFNSPERTVITASLDYTLRVWNADTGIEVRMLQGHSGPIRGMCFHENSDAVWTASGDHSVKRWDVALGAATGETILRGHTEDLLSLEFGPDQRTLVSVSRDATARVWSLPGIHEPWIVQVDNAAVSCASLSPDGKRLATGATDGTVTIWSVETREALGKLSKHTGPVSGVWYNPIRAQLLSVSRDNTAVLWAIEDGTPLFQKEVTDGGRGLGAISPDGERIALPAAENSAVLLDTGTGDSSTILKGHTQRITSFVFSPDSAKFATTSLDGTARLWNVADGALLYTLEDQASEVACGAFSPDGTQIATGTLSGTAHVWDVATGELLGTLEGHGAMLVDLAYTRDGTRLFSLSEDGTVRLWNPAEQVEMLRLEVGEPFQGDVAMACSEREIASSWNGIDIMVRSAAVPAVP